MDDNWKNGDNKDFRLSIMNQFPKGITNLNALEANIYSQSRTKNEYMQKMKMLYQQMLNAQQQQQQQQQQQNQSQQPQAAHQPQSQPQQVQQPNTAPSQSTMQTYTTIPQQHQLGTQQQQQPAYQNQPHTITAQVIRKPTQSPYAPQTPMQPNINIIQQQPQPTGQQPPQTQQLKPTTINIQPNMRPTALQPPQQTQPQNIPTQQQQFQKFAPAPQQNPYVGQIITTAPQAQPTPQQPSQAPILQQQIAIGEEEQYQKKIQDLQPYIHSLQEYIANSKTESADASRIRNLIDVLMQKKKVSFKVLSQCEELIKQRFAPHYIQPRPQPSQIPQQPPQQVQIQAPPPQQQQPDVQVETQIYSSQYQPPQKMQAHPLVQPKVVTIPATTVPAVNAPKLSVASNTVPQPIGGLKPEAQQAPVVVVPPQPAPQPQPPQPPKPQLNVYQTLARNIEMCNNANVVHKNGVRYFMDSVKKIIGGPEFKSVKVQKMAPFGARDRKKVRKAEKIIGEMPRTLILELNGLPSMKFKVSLKSKRFSAIFPMSLAGSGNELSDEDYEALVRKYSSAFIVLSCSISAAKLPHVPPIRILVPMNYPESNPVVELAQSGADECGEDMLPGYHKLGILKKINKVFQKNYLALRDRHSITQILDSWYSSIENI